MVLKTKISVLCIVKGGKPMDKQKELIALLFAISVVSARLARNIEKEVKHNESNRTSHEYNR